MCVLTCVTNTAGYVTNLACVHSHLTMSEVCAAAVPPKTSFIARAGYGNSAPNNCWGPVMLVTVQTLVGVFLDAVVIGVIFARISHPKHAHHTCLLHVTVDQSVSKVTMRTYYELLVIT